MVDYSEALRIFDETDKAPVKQAPAPSMMEGFGESRLSPQQVLDAFDSTEPDQGYGEIIAKGVVRGAEGMASGAGAALNWAGEVAGSEPVAKAGKTVQEYFDKAASEGWARPDPNVFRGEFMENPSFKRAAGIISESAASLGGALLLGGGVGAAARGLGAGVKIASALGKTSAAGGLGLLEGAPQYQEAREAGKSVAEASGIGAASTVGTGILEFLAIDRFFKPFKGTIGQAAKKAVTEFGPVESVQEVLQQGWQNAIAKFGYDETRSLTEGMVEAAIGGFGAGAISGTAGHVGGQKINDFIDRQRKKGIPDEEISQGIEDIGAKVTEAMDQKADDVTQKPVTDEITTGANDILRQAEAPDLDPEALLTGQVPLDQIPPGVREFSPPGPVAPAASEVVPQSVAEEGLQRRLSPEDVLSAFDSAPAAQGPAAPVPVSETPAVPTADVQPIEPQPEMTGALPETQPPTIGQPVPGAQAAQAPPPKPMAPTAPAVESKVSTLRGRIRQMEGGGINPINFKGEFKEAGAVRYLLKNKGMPIDLAEQQLRDEGWLRPDENMIDVLRDPANLRRNKVAGEGVVKAASQMTEQEKRVEREMNREVEAPPGDIQKDYVTITADELPVGKEITLVEGKSKDGWDKYKVKSKDEFGVELEDGQTIHLPPGHVVEALASDMEAAENVKPEAAAAATTPAQAPEAKEPWQMRQVEVSSKKAESVFPIASKVEVKNGKPRYTYSTTLKWGDTNKTFEIESTSQPNATTMAERLHKKVIEQAISEGKPVPTEVLADYPNLQPKAPSAAEPSAPAKRENLREKSLRLLREHIAGMTEEQKARKTAEAPDWIASGEKNPAQALYHLQRNYPIQKQEAAADGIKPAASEETNPASAAENVAKTAPIAETKAETKATEAENPDFTRKINWMGTEVEVPYFAINKDIQLHPSSKNTKVIHSVIKTINKDNYRISVIENEDGSRYANVEKGSDENGSLSRVDVRFKWLPSGQWEDVRSINNAAKSLFQQFPKEQPSLFLQGEKQMPAAQAEMRTRGKKLGQAEQGGIEFGTPETPAELDLKGEKAGAKEAERAKEIIEETTAPKSPTKEPWEMTQVEFYENEDVKITTSPTKSAAGNLAYKYTANYGGTEVSFVQKSQNINRATEILHKKFVEQALREGKPVSSEVLKDYPDLAKTAEKKPAHDHSSTQVNLPKGAAKSIVDFGNTIPDSEIYTDQEDPSYGREKEPHITIRYGLATDDPAKLQKAFAGTGPIKATFGKVSIFKNDKYDVVKVDIESENLHKANSLVGETESTPGETFKKYKPHATIAYVKSGEGQKYVGNDSLNGKEVTIDKIYLSDRNGEQHEIDLRAEKPAEKTEPQPVGEKQGAETTDKIEDFGEKIGGARKDLAESGFTKGQRTKTEDSEPTWKKKFKVMESVKEPGQWSVVKVSKDRWATRSASQKFSSQEEAEKALPLFAVAQSFYPNQNKDGSWDLVKKIGERKRLEMTQKKFPSREDAMKYMATNAEALLNTRTSFGEEILPVPDTVNRKGAERRTGPATRDMFVETFAPRAIEFGNWNNQEERQLVMNHAYDGLLDLADALGVPPKALMLNGELAIAFGARGQGLTGAKAHYEPDYSVINLTKMKGAGSLAHEWLHAFDHHLARIDTKADSKRVENKRGDKVFPEQALKYQMQSHGPSYKSQMRPELKDAYDRLIKTMVKKGEQYVEDTKRADEFLGRARENLKGTLDRIRQEIQRDMTAYAKSKGGYRKSEKGLHPANAEQLAEFDRLADSLVEGGNLETEFRPNHTQEEIDAAQKEGKKLRRSEWGRLSAGRQSNDTLDAINAIYKAVRNRSGFTTEHSGLLDGVRAAMNTYRDRLKMFEDAKAGTEKTKQVPTNYAIEARKMDQARVGDYWSEPHEMAARAFAAYVEDKIAEQGGQSDFLVYHAHGGIILPMIDGFVARPYPEGKEREAVNKTFDEFVKTLQVEETDKGVTLLKKGDETPAAAPGTAIDRRAMDGTKENVERIQQLVPVVERAMRTAGLPQEVIDLVRVELKPIIDLRGKDVDQTLADWASEGKEMSAILGATTIRKWNALMELSLEQDLNSLEKTTFHESFHIAAKWLLPGSDYSRVMQHYRTEEGAADAFADFVSRRSGGRPAPVGVIRRAFIKLRNLMQQIGSFLRGKGWTSAEDVFGKLAAGEYAPHFGRGQGGTTTALQAEQRAPVWYSQMEKFLGAKLPGSGTGKSFVAAIDSWARKGEFKAEELEWSGIKDWLAGQEGKLTKQQVLDYLRENNVRVQEVVKGGPEEKDLGAAQRDMSELEDKGYYIDFEDNFDGDAYPAEITLPKKYGSRKLVFSEIAEDGSILTNLREVDPHIPDEDANAIYRLARYDYTRAPEGTVYSQYQLPGGENYRELLLTLPRKSYGDLNKTEFDEFKALSSKARSSDLTPEEKTRYGHLEKKSLVVRPEFRSSHYPEPDILAHVRFNERVDADGKRVLFIEEVQSDWHQKGRKKGYSNPQKDQAEFQKLGQEWDDLSVLIRKPADTESELKKREAALARQLVISEQMNKITDRKQYGTPNAPFKTTWPMLAMRRMVRYAAENGFDRVAWTTGEQQAARYDLSKQVRSIEAAPLPGGVYKVTARPLDGGEAINLGEKTAKELPDVVGKELAQKIDDQGGGVFSGLDLKVGGEGMKGFYDKILPAEVNKFFGKAAWGNARVGQTEIPIGRNPTIGQLNTMYSDEVWEKMKSERVGHAAVHSLDITPQMRERALTEGMTQFNVKALWELPSGELSQRLGAQRVFFDNPGGDWLRDEQRKAKRNNGGGSVTAGIRKIVLPISVLEKLHGQMGEHNRIGASDERVLDLANKIRKEGFTSVPFLNVEWDGSVNVSEGNHRIRAARLAGLNAIPVDISYYAGGERAAGPMSFDNLVKYRDGLSEKGGALSVSDQYSAAEDVKPETRFRVGRKQTEPESSIAAEILPAHVAPRAQKAFAGVDRGPILEKIKAGFLEAVKTFTPGREYVAMDPRHFGQAYEILRNFKATKPYADHKAIDNLREILDPKNMPKRDYELFSLKLALDDLDREIGEGGKYENWQAMVEKYGALQFGFKSADEVKESLDKANALVAENKTVQDALKRRDEITFDLLKQVVAAKLLPESVLKDRRYFHHQVLEYMNDKFGTGTGAGALRVGNKGYQRGRIENVKDYSLAYIESEFEVMAHQISQIEKQKNMDEMKAAYDISKRLERQAKHNNYVAVVGGQENMDRINHLRGLIAEMKGMGGLDSGEKAQLKEWADEIRELDPTMPFRQKMAMGYAKLSKALGLKEDESDVDDYAIDMSEVAEYANSTNEELAIPARMIFKAMGDRNAFIKEALGGKFVTASDLARKEKPIAGSQGYTEWVPNPRSAFYLTGSIQDAIAQQIMAGARELQAKDIRPVLARGRDETWIIPAELAQALESQQFNINQHENIVSKTSEAILNNWKRWILLNPMRIAKYNLNNTSGDFDIAMAYDPRIFKGVKQAAADLWKWHYGKDMAPELKAEIDTALRDEVIGSGMTVHDIPDVRNQEGLRELVEAMGAGSPSALRYIEKFWQGSKNFTTWRENVLRLAAYRHFKDQIAAGKNVYGASIPAKVDAVTDADRKAALLSRELVGDYGALSQGGQWLRRKMVPFYSWLEINAPRYYRMYANLAVEGESQGRAARAGAVLAKKGLFLSAKVFAMYAAAGMFNHLFWPDEEEELGEFGRRQSHLILGRRDDGSIITLRLQGALSDALSWFNLHDFPEDMRQIAAGKKTVLKQLGEGAVEPVNKLLQGARPDIKTSAELLSGRTLYPEFWSPRPIRDKAEQVAGALGVADLYRRAAGKPLRGGSVEQRVLSDLLSVFTYSADPGETSYYKARDLVGDYMKDHNIERPTADPTNRATALHYYKQALKFGDAKAAEKYLQAYKEYGGNTKGIEASVKRAHPLGALPNAHRARFFNSLDQEDRQAIKRATEWYRTTYKGGSAA